VTPGEAAWTAMGGGCALLLFCAVLFRAALGNALRDIWNCYASWWDWIASPTIRRQRRRRKALPERANPELVVRLEHQLLARYGQPVWQWQAEAVHAMKPEEPQPCACLDCRPPLAGGWDVGPCDLVPRAVGLSYPDGVASYVSEPVALEDRYYEKLATAMMRPETTLADQMAMTADYMSAAGSSRAEIQREMVRMHPPVMRATPPEV
jgi:hypothetical protein